MQAIEPQPSSYPIWPAEIKPEAISAQLQRVLASTQLAGSPRLRDFLQFVVDESLAGRSERIKGTAIGEAVFSGDDNFDPQTSAIVRVEAGRLRRRLAEYYMTDGRGDSIVINIPKGTYVPDFRPREVASAMPGSSSSTVNTTTSDKAMRRPVLAGTAILVFVILFVASLYMTADGPGSPIATEATAPFIAVLPFNRTSDSAVEERLAAGLVEAIITKLSNLSGLSVMAHASVLGLESSPLNTTSLNRDFGITHILRGTLRSESDIMWW